MNRKISPGPLRDNPPALSSTDASSGPHASDAGLLAGLALGDERCLAEVYRRHAGDVWAVARRLTGDDGLAEDVVQDVFVRFWHNPEAFDPGRGSLRTYLTVIARSRSSDVLRSERARRLREQAEHARRVVDLRDDPAAKAVAHEEIGDVIRAMETLAPEQRAVLQRAYFNGHTCRQIAADLAIPEGTVKSRMRLGLQHLRTVIC